MNRFVQLSLIALALNWPAWGQIQQSRTAQGARLITVAAQDLTAETASGVVAYRRRIRADLTATTRAGSAIAEVTIKARRRAWTDACGTFTRITGFQTMFHSTRLRLPERVQS